MLCAQLSIALIAAQTDAQADAKPIIAVFSIVDRRGVLGDDQIVQLTDYLAVKITETGRFLVVARSEIEEALRAQKVDSYKVCTDESCQIEIGKELAAQKALHTQIVQVGDRCAVAATLYDLKLAATERAASEKGACDANALVVSLEAVAGQLAGLKAAIDATPPPPPAKQAEETFALKIDSSPRRAELSIDGRSEGQTPMTVKLPRGKPQQVRVERDGYEPYVETVSMDRDQQRSIALRMTPERKRSRTEWFGASLSVGATLSGGIDVGVWLRLINLHFGSFTLTVLEALGGPVFTKETRDEGSCGTDDDTKNGYCRKSVIVPKVYVGPRVGYKLTFREDHNLEISVGGGFFTTFTDSDDGVTAGAVSPGIRYLFLGDGRFSWGIGVRAIVPIRTQSCTDQVAGSSSLLADYAACMHSRPYFLQLEIPIGWYF